MLASGALTAFNLHEVMPTSDPSTWLPRVKNQGLEMSSLEQNVAFVRVGATKGRTLGKSKA